MISITKRRDVGGRIDVRGDTLIRLAEQRMSHGFATPPEIYRIENRRRIDWLLFPSWARPVDPQVFEGCCHEGSPPRSPSGNRR
jgi:hypothetical protein